MLKIDRRWQVLSINQARVIGSGHGNALSACLGAFGYLSDVHLCTSPPTFTIPVPHSARFAHYMYIRLIEHIIRRLVCCLVAQMCGCMVRGLDVVGAVLNEGASRPHF